MKHNSRVRFKYTLSRITRASDDPVYLDLKIAIYQVLLHVRNIRTNSRFIVPHATAGAAVAANRMVSSRTITRDLRRSEFKEMMKRTDATNLLLKQLIELKKQELKLKYPNANIQF